MHNIQSKGAIRMKVHFKFIFFCFSCVMVASQVYSDDFSCEPTEVAVFPERIHLRCQDTLNDGSSTIRFWSVATTDADHANRFLSTATTAIVSGRSVILKYTPGDTSGTVFNCKSDDCRKIWGILIQ